MDRAAELRHDSLSGRDRDSGGSISSENGDADGRGRKPNFRIIINQNNRVNLQATKP